MLISLNPYFFSSSGIVVQSSILIGTGFLDDGVYLSYTNCMASKSFSSFMATNVWFQKNATVPPFFKGEGSASTCMADVPLAFFGFICVMLLLSNLKQKKGVMVIPAGLALFFCAFTKAEGLYYSLIFMFSVFVASFVEDKSSRGVLLKHTVLMAGVLTVLYMPWLIFYSPKHLCTIWI